MISHVYGEHSASDRTKRRAVLANARHEAHHASSQKSPSGSPAEPRSAFYQSKIHQCDIKEVFHTSTVRLTHSASQRRLGGRASCARCSQLQPLRAQLSRRDAQPNRSHGTRNARRNEVVPASSAPCSTVDSTPPPYP